MWDGIVGSMLKNGSGLNIIFFQALGGIRVVKTSRGLGDVYSRQYQDFDIEPTAFTPENLGYLR